MRSPRDSDAVARQWQKHNRIAFQGGADTRAIVKMQRDIEKLRRRVVSQSPQSDTPLWEMSWSGDYVAIMAKKSDLDDVVAFSNNRYGADISILYGCYIWDYYNTDGTNTMWAIPQNDHTFILMWIPNIPPDAPIYDNYSGGIVAYDVEGDKFYVPNRVGDTYTMVEADIDTDLGFAYYIEVGRVKNKIITQKTSGDVWEIWQLCSMLAPDWRFSVLMPNGIEQADCKFMGKIQDSGYQNASRGWIGFTEDSNFMYWWMCDPPVPGTGSNDFFHYNGAQKVLINYNSYAPDPATPVPSSTNPWRLMSYAPKIQMTLASGAYDSSKKYFRQS